MQIHLLKLLQESRIEKNGLIHLLKSMTGYGRYEANIDGRSITFEIRTVNHKYFEFSARITRGYLFLEDKVKSYVQSMISRGKVDVFIQIETLDDTDVQVQVNHSLASGYVMALREIKERYRLPDVVTLDVITRHSDIFSVHKAPENEELIFSAVKQVAKPALENLISMRQAEGEKLQKDILARAENIIGIVGEIEKAAPETVRDYETRLKTKIKEVLSDSRFDEQRVLTEVAIFADKLAVDEETVRLRSHFDQLKVMLKSDGPIGRKMDFLIQEMNREANTIASKSQNSGIAYKIVDIKSEIEKIREQIQNVE